MSHDHLSDHLSGSFISAGTGSSIAPGKRALTDRLQRKAADATTGAGEAARSSDAPPRWRDPTLSPGVSYLDTILASPVQCHAAGAVAADDVHAHAARGTAGAGEQLPFLDRIQASFGPHDVRGVVAHTDGAAASAATAIGATAFATGNHVAFAGAPDLHTAAHEAAHVVQQRAGVHLKGGVGEVGDVYEQHADAVADRVVAGESAADLLGATSSSSSTAVQRDVGPHAQGDAKADAGGDAKADGTLTIVLASMKVQNAYRRVFQHQRDGLTRVGAALKKDATPKKSLLGELAAGVVGGAIGVVLGPVAAGVVEFAESKMAKKLIEKLADFVKDKAIDIGKEKTKEHFEGKKETDAADNFVLAQALAISDVEKGALDGVVDQTAELASVAKGPESLASLATQVDARAPAAPDIHVAQAAGAWARATAGSHATAGAWADDVAGQDPEKGAIEIECRHERGVGITITGSNWRGVGSETEGVVQEQGKATISDLRATLRVTVAGFSGKGRFEITPEGQVWVPENSVGQDALFAAAGFMEDRQDLAVRKESAIKAAKYIAYLINQQSVSALKFGK